MVAGLPLLFLLAVIAEYLLVLCLDGFQFVLVLRHIGQQLVKIKFHRLISSLCIKVNRPCVTLTPAFSSTSMWVHHFAVFGAGCEAK